MERETKDQTSTPQAKKRRQRRLAVTEGPLERGKAVDFNWKPRKKESSPFSRNRRSHSRAYARLYLDRSRLFKGKGNAGPFDSLGLTRRETEVLTWITQGKTNYEIGLIIGAGTRTICKHVQRILNKLDAENRTAAAAIALGTLANVKK